MQSCQTEASSNNGEDRNALARAVFLNRQGELRDRSFGNQRLPRLWPKSRGGAIVLWTTVYLQRATQGLKVHGQSIDDNLLQRLSPLGWEHINLTGDYVWRQGKQFERGEFRPLRPFDNP